MVTIQPTTIYVQETPSMSKWRNHPQSTAMIAGALVLTSGGMNLAAGLGWNMNTHVVTTVQLQYCWFICVMIGAITAAPLIPILPKKMYMLVSGLFVLASGIVYVSAPYDYDAIISARCINGFATGFAGEAFIIHASEVGARNYRGTCLAISQFATILGITIQVIYSSQWTYYTYFAANQLLGIFGIVFGVFAMVAAFIVIESPIFFLRRGIEAAALDCQRRLVRPQVVTTETQILLDEAKRYLAENERIHKGMGPLIKMILYYSMVAFSFALPLSIAIVLASYVSEGYQYSWPPILFAIMRLFGATLSMWMLDGLGRKLISLFSLICMTGLIFGIGGIFSYQLNLYDAYEMSIVCTLSILFQFFAGMYAPSAVVYLGEAFPMHVKPYSIALCIIVEQAIQVIVISTFTFDMYNMYVYCITVGVIMFVLFFVFSATMPETRNTTLREAQDRFNPLLFLKAY